MRRREEEKYHSDSIEIGECAMGNEFLKIVMPSIPANTSECGKFWNRLTESKLTTADGEMDVDSREMLDQP